MNKHSKQKGQIVISAVLFFLIVTGTLLGGATLPVGNQIKSSQDFLRSKKSHTASEAVNDDAFYRLNKGKTLPATISLPFQGDVVATGQVTDTSGGKQISTTGETNDLFRSNRSIFSQSSGASFSYGLQVGNGGVTMTGSSKIKGSVYSNGPISGCSSCEITGSATASNASDPTIDQSNGSGTPTNNITFANSSSVQDFAQGFKVGTTTSVVGARFYIKKVGSPSNVTLRITSDNGGKPSKTTLAQGTLSANLVSTSYGYVEVLLDSSVALSLSTQYWLVIDATNSTTNYFVIGALDNTYSNGVAKTGAWASSNGGTWNATSPSTLDAFFDLYVGGSIGRIYGESQYNRLKIGSSGVGTAWAHDVDYINIEDKAYCQTGEHIYKNSNLQACDTSRGDPSPVAFPVSDANITEWKDAVTNGIGTISGGWTYNGNLTIGSSGTTTSTLKKVVGNLSVNCDDSHDSSFGDIYVTGNISFGSSCEVSLGNIQVDGTFSTGGSSEVTFGYLKVGSSATINSDTFMKNVAWIVGNLTIGGSSKFQLAPNLGVSDGYVVVDGKVDVGGSGAAMGSGTNGSYIVIVTTSQCPFSGSCSGNPAINISGSAGSVVLVAPYGQVSISGSGKAKSVVGKKMLMSGSAELEYESGLTDLDFVNGPMGSWTVDSWREIFP